MRFAKAAARPAVSVPARFFSQTARVAEDPNEQAIVEDAIKSTEEASTLTSESAATPEEGGIPLFISNITFDATDLHLREAFSKYGEIVSIKIGRDGRGLSRGFAFVTFANRADADRAVAECNMSFWHGRRITVEHRKNKNASVVSHRQPTEEPTTSLYIGNIPYETSDADLNRLFRELENVTDVRVAVDRNTGWPRGFAHADFTDIESAIKAYEKIAATSMGGRMLRVDYSQKRSPNSNGNRRPGGQRGQRDQRDQRDPRDSGEVRDRSDFLD
ncbi:hypothetical protein AB5N19_05462 [Seiridium cardinale]|uniref:RRM domain-containing protein n=1 Tax=Seiridium cardinale TaxID=138064 RepID=A0ABR2XIN8_9PEZI